MPTYISGNVIYNLEDVGKADYSPPASSERYLNLILEYYLPIPLLGINKEL